MATFSYLIRTPDGIRKEGDIEAGNLTDATESLRQEGNIVVRVTEKDTSFDFMGPFIERFNYAMTRLKVHIPLNTIVFFTRQLATMFAAGLTIERALHFLALEEKHKKYKQVVKKIEFDIKKGLLLSDTLERHPGVFSNLYISLIRAGEVSGKLSDTLDELAIYMEKMEDTRRKVISALIYPIVMLAMLTAVMFIAFMFLIPTFSGIYEELGSDLPGFTLVLTLIANWVTNNYLWVIFYFLLFNFSMWFFYLTDTGRLFFDRFKLSTPIFGNLIKQNILAKFTKTFGILLSSGVSVLEAMELTAKVVENRVFELAVAKAMKDIENGIAISRALKDTKTFPPIMIQLISTGEETGEIDNLTLKASEFYTKQVDATVDRLTSILEPILLLIVAVIIGVILIGIYLPIFQFGEAFQ